MSSWQVRHGQSVYRVTVKEMVMDKAERALELADLLVAESCKSMAIGEDDADEIADALRDYHSLRKKYDALLNTEPVAEVRPHVRLDGWKMINYKFADVNRLAVGTKLIIKPAE